MSPRRLAFPLFVAALVTAALLSAIDLSRPAQAGDEVAVKARAAASTTSLTASATKAAKAFKASLSSSQQSAMQFSFGASTKKTSWSNLPTNLVPRKGVKVADLSSAQKTKLLALLKVMLSSKGYADEEAVRKADQYLNAKGGGNGYGEGLYYVAFYGTPSTSKKWTVQFGGHHLALHVTFAGDAISGTPYFQGVEPKAAFTQDGRTYQPMADEASALFGVVAALNATQKAQAKLSQSFDDVLMGPGKDTGFPARQGITVSKLSSSQQTIVTRAIRSYVADLPTSQANEIVAAYKKQYSSTKLAYSGGADGDTAGGYVRLHGPRVWIEIATQNGIVIRDTTHYHSIERDIKTDYGAGI